MGLDVTRYKYRATPAFLTAFVTQGSRPALMPTRVRLSRATPDPHSRASPTASSAGSKTPDVRRMSPVLLHREESHQKEQTPILQH